MPDEHPYDHGAVDPRTGDVYDESRRAWVHPSSLTRKVSYDYAGPSESLKRAAAGKRDEWDRLQRQGRQRRGEEFVRSQQMEELRALRERDRATFDKVAAGTRRQSLGRYENDLREHLAAGHPLPDGVRPL